MTDETPTEKVKHSSLAAALVAAQSEMGSAKKTANNPHFKSKYADLDAVCDAVMPALNRHGIAVVQPLQNVDGDWVVVTCFKHADSDQTIEGPVPILLGKRDMQGLGSAITYARRYGLMCLSGIAPEDDDGNDAGQGNGGQFRQKRKDTPPEQPKAPPASELKDAKEYLTGAKDLEELRWRFGNLPKDVRAHKDVIAAKDARKAALTPMVEPNQKPVIENDEIPY